MLKQIIELEHTFRVRRHNPKAIYQDEMLKARS